MKHLLKSVIPTASFIHPRKATHTRFHGLVCKGPLFISWAPRLGSDMVQLPVSHVVTANFYVKCFPFLQWLLCFVFSSSVLMVQSLAWRRHTALMVLLMIMAKLFFYFRKLVCMFLSPKYVMYCHFLTKQGKISPSLSRTTPTNICHGAMAFINP